MGLFDDLLPAMQDVFKIRQDIGAVLEVVSVVIRTWSGTQPGDGEPTDVAIVVDPQPGIKDLSHNIRIAEGGAYEQGDLILTGLYKAGMFATQDQAELASPLPNVQKFFKIDNRFYKVISTKEKPFSWDVQVRKILDDTAY